MSFFQDWLIPLLQNHGLLIVFLTMVAESACIPIPSEVVVPYGGFLAAQGHTHLWMVIVVATAANLVGFEHRLRGGPVRGPGALPALRQYVRCAPHHLDKADDWFEQRGQVTVFFTRMMPGVRTFISLPAGIAKMPVVKFLLYSAARLGPLERRARLPGLRRPARPLGEEAGTGCRSSSAATTTSSTSCWRSSCSL